MCVISLFPGMDDCSFLLKGRVRSSVGTFSDANKPVPFHSTSWLLMCNGLLLERVAMSYLPGNRSGLLYSWDAKSMQPTPSRAIPGLEGPDPLAQYEWHSAVSADGSTVVASSYGDCLVMDLLSRKQLHRFRNASVRVPRAIAMSPDGLYLARFVNQPPVLVLYELPSYQEILRLPRPYRSVAFSPHGNQLAVASNIDGTIELWFLRDLFLQLGAGTVGSRLTSSLLWQNLASSDTALAYQAVGFLLAHERIAISLLTQHLQPASALNGTVVDSLVARLNASTFPDREQATTRLASMGQEIVPRLEHELKRKALAPESRRRLNSILLRLALLLLRNAGSFGRSSFLNPSRRKEPFACCNNSQRASRSLLTTAAQAACARTIAVPR